MGEEFIRRIMVLGEVPSLGPVILFDDMEDLFKWTAGGTAGDRVVEKSASVAYNKAASLHLKSRTTDAADGDYVSASRYTHQRPGKRYAVECLFRYEVYANMELLTFYVDLYDGTKTHHLGIQWNAQTERWFCKNAAGGWSDLDPFLIGPNALGWHRIEFKFDQHAAKYLWLIVDGVEKDISAWAYQTVTEAGWVHMQVTLEFETVGAAAVEGYFDDVLIMEI